MSELARNADPWPAHEAAERITPRLGTRRAQALGLLLSHRGEWIDAARFQTPHTGGAMSGTRRVRELRASGWPIEIRPKPGERNTWQYRLRHEDELELDGDVDDEPDSPDLRLLELKRGE